MIELDSKSLNSLAGASTGGHSRKNSDASQISYNSGNLHTMQRMGLHLFPVQMMAH